MKFSRNLDERVDDVVKLAQQWLVSKVATDFSIRYVVLELDIKSKFLPNKINMLKFPSF